MGTRRMLAAAIAGACCLVVGVVLMTSAARSAATTVPAPVGPGGAAVFNPATVTGTFGHHCRLHPAFGMKGSVKVPLTRYRNSATGKASGYSPVATVKIT